jgi:hypothetical protein
MEEMIRKKQKKKGVSTGLNSQSDKNSFAEVEHYLKLPQVRQEDCPNLIPWWDVSCKLFDLF